MTPLLAEASNSTGAGSFESTVEAVRTRAYAAGWRVRPHEFWCFVETPHGVRRTQGWKLHVSATPVSAPTVLERVARILIGHGCSFKFAGTTERVVELTSAHCDRGGSGKFVTAYPDDDDHLRRIAADLDAATHGLAGPAILSDLPYRPGSLVHLRYGGFRAPVVLS